MEPPPENARPEHVLKYVTHYLTGGPISDRRLISREQGQFTFRPRGKDKPIGDQPQPFRLAAAEFVRR